MKQAKRLKALDQVYNLEYWSVENHGAHSVVQLINRANNRWESVAEIKGSSHKALADFILSRIKAHGRQADQLQEASNALKLCIESGDLSWEAEQASEIILRKLRDKATS